MTRDVKIKAGGDGIYAERDVNIGGPKAAAPPKPATDTGGEKPKSPLEQATKVLTSTTGLVTAAAALLAAAVAAAAKMGWLS
jgi:hypothetical protein